MNTIADVGPRFPFVRSRDVKTRTPRRVSRRRGVLFDSGLSDGIAVTQIGFLVAV